MDDHRKKAGVMFWITVVVVAIPVLYFASLGPMVMANRPMLMKYPDEWFEIYAAYMAPANYVRECLPAPVRRAFDDYHSWWAMPDNGPIRVKSR